MHQKSKSIVLKKYISLNTSENDIEQIGKKAFNLLKIEKSRVPKYIIIKACLFDVWKINSKSALDILDNLLPSILSCFPNETVIIRSSALIENFEQRGYYESSNSGVKHCDIKKEIVRLWEENSKLLDSEISFSLIVQQYINPVNIGHLSNERRITKHKNQYHCEILDCKNNFLGSRIIKLHKHDSHINEKTNITKDLLAADLEKIVSYNYNDSYHIEWVWDGKKVWIVQIDFEEKNLNEDEPGLSWKKRGKITESKIEPLSVLKELKSSSNSWKKAECVKTFKELDLPSGEIYLIEDSTILRKILDGEDLTALIKDLNWLLTSPIVIRMDVKNGDNQTYLLPRTETLFSLEKVLCFLHEKIEYVKKQGVGLDEMCFLLHRFIVSKSCALAYSKPEIPRTRIDSTWGIVDGLYYHPHDSFEQNSSSSKIKEGIRCKTEYLDIDETGNWISKKTNEKYDWKKSLTSKEIHTIASYNEKIASFLRKPVTVMYFVGVFKNTGYPEILPWYYTVEEIPESSEKFSEIIFSEKKVVITTKIDFDKKKSKLKESKNKISINLKLSPDLLRDRDFLEEIARFSKDEKIPINLEGSILSHPYYILKKNDAIVKTTDTFDPTYQKQSFYKLVRDKIPVRIMSKGETVNFLHISPIQTLELIKQKLIEESLECFWESEEDKIIEELADIYELLRGASNAFGIDMSEIVKIADNKKEKSGGFDNSVFLIETKETSLIPVSEGGKREMEMSVGIGESSEKETLVPYHQKCHYSKVKKVLTVPYIPSFVNTKTNKRSELINIDSDKDYLITYDTKDITIEIVDDSVDKNKNQLKIDFSK